MCRPSRRWKGGGGCHSVLELTVTLTRIVTLALSPEASVGGREGVAATVYLCVLGVCAVPYAAYAMMSVTDDVPEVRRAGGVCSAPAIGLFNIQTLPEHDICMHPRTHMLRMQMCMCVRMHMRACACMSIVQPASPCKSMPPPRGQEGKCTPQGVFWGGGEGAVATWLGSGRSGMPRGCKVGRREQNRTGPNMNMTSAPAR